jgi:hypothetical protein
MLIIGKLWPVSKQSPKSIDFRWVRFGQLEEAMNRDRMDSIIVLLLPLTSTMVELLNAYRLTGQEVRKWREARNQDSASGSGITASTNYFSFYADPLREELVHDCTGPFPIGQP